MTSPVVTVAKIAGMIGGSMTAVIDHIGAGGTTAGMRIVGTGAATPGVRPIRRRATAAPASGATINVSAAGAEAPA